jgi:hypothetical protein
LTPQERDAVSSIRYMHCPGRRSGYRQIPMRGETDLYAGPTSDYAVVFFDKEFDGQKFGDPDTSDKSGWQLHQDPTNTEHVERQKGAIRLAYVDRMGIQEAGDDAAALAQAYSRWKPRDTFARCTDGTANVLLVGEKHVRGNELGKYSASQNEQDGSYWFTSAKGERAYNVARNIGLPFATGSSFGSGKGEGPRKEFGFGGPHGGINFLRGDGSAVRLPAGLDQKVKCQLGHVQDGLTLPGQGGNRRR